MRQVESGHRVLQRRQNSTFDVDTPHRITFLWTHVRDVSVMEGEFQVERFQWFLETHLTVNFVLLLLVHQFGIAKVDVT